MRLILLVPLLAAGACSEASEAPKPAAAPKVDALQAGQWETVTEVTRLVPKDKGSPKINTPAGTKTTASLCVAEGDSKKPDPKLFAGSKDSCEYDNFYMSSGTLNASMKCSRPGLAGTLMTTIYGDYTGDSLNATLDTVTYLATDGDVSIAAKMTGRRVGECTAETDDSAG
jgi:Protein of unknown function (DUF3617)